MVNILQYTTINTAVNRRKYCSNYILYYSKDYSKNCSILELKYTIVIVLYYAIVYTTVYTIVYYSVYYSIYYSIL